VPATYKLKVGWPETHAELILLHETVRKAVRALRGTIAQANIIGNRKFLVNSQNLNWKNNARFREELQELPLGNLSSEKFATSERSFTKLIVVGS
jgi:hypothetical protein